MEKINHLNWEFETITKHTMDIILIVDRNQLVKYVTPSFQIVLGYSSEEVVGKNAFDPVHPDDRECLMEAHREVIISQQPKTNEYRVFHKNGQLKYLESRVMPIPDHPDQLAVVAIRDITARKNMETEIQNRKNRYEELQNSLKNFSHDLSSVMKVSDLEHRLLKELKTVIPNSQPSILIFNRGNQKIEGNHSIELEPYLPQLTVGKMESARDQVLILIGNRGDHAYVLVLQAPSIIETMESIWVETLVYYAIKVFESLNVIDKIMNQLELALPKKERPQWILRLLFNLAEKQRTDLSSDLHDTVLQDLIDLYRRMEALPNQFQIDREIQEQLKEIVQRLLDTIHQIRTTCNELRPPLLREMGLESALENLFEYTQVSSLYKIHFETENTIDLGLDEEQTIGIYRIVQELLNNATRHSQASNLHFYIKKQDNHLIVEYSDDGIGLKQEKLSPSFHSMGLSGMGERAQSLGGNIEYGSNPGGGLRVRMQLPINGV
jgi:two-component system, NarL family, sensor histidine kinase ComP